MKITQNEVIFLRLIFNKMTYIVKHIITLLKAIYSWKPISRRPTGRPKTRWEDDVRKDIQKIKVPNWKTLAQDRRKWKELVEKAKTL